MVLEVCSNPCGEYSLIFVLWEWEVQVKERVSGTLRWKICFLASIPLQTREALSWQCSHPERQNLCAWPQTLVTVSRFKARSWRGTSSASARTKCELSEAMTSFVCVVSDSRGNKRRFQIIFTSQTTNASTQRSQASISTGEIQIRLNTTYFQRTLVEWWLCWPIWSETTSSPPVLEATSSFVQFSIQRKGSRFPVFPVVPKQNKGSFGTWLGKDKTAELNTGTSLSHWGGTNFILRPQGFGPVSKWGWSHAEPTPIM